jgi:6-phosphogluconate dehydrogenase (decarboxylating)
MELALIGLGRMGMNMVTRLLRGNHRISLTCSASFSLWHQEGNQMIVQRR